VAFSPVQYTGHQSGLQGVFRLDGTVLTRIDPLSGNGYFFTDSVVLASSGLATYDSPASSYSNVSVGDGSTAQVVYFGTEFHAGPNFVRANDAGVIVFTGNGEGGDKTVLVNGPTHTVIADAFMYDPGAFSYLAGADINNQGTVVFIGKPKLGSGGATLYQYQNSQVTPLLDLALTDYTFIDGMPGINDFGELLFFTHLKNGSTGIFSGPDSVHDKVVETGDVIGGRTVTDVESLGAINNAGQVAFGASFADGSSGIYLATPVPEPDGAILALIGATVLPLYVSRHRAQARA
jgi:hypothetical protein